jgi:all-trans-retinol 13,14-reductase
MNIAIIGGGLSGLLTAFLLGKKGYTSTIYEKLPKVGGVIDSFKRKSVMFDVGFHYSGSLAPGQFLYEEFKKHNILDKFELYEYEDIFDSLYLDGELFTIPNTYDAFVTKLHHYFPDEKAAIDVFFRECYQAGEISIKPKDDFINIDSRSLKDVLKDIKAQKLRKVLLHFTIFYADIFYEEASFEIYAKILTNMLDGTRKIRGNGRAIIDVLTQSLEHTTINIRTEVEKIIQENGAVKAVVINGKRLEYDAVICTLHPRTMMNFFDDSDRKLNRYRKHVSELTDSRSFYSIFCLVDTDIKSNLYFYSGDHTLYSVLPSDKKGSKTIVTILAESSYEKYIDLPKSEYKKLKEEECNSHIAKIKKLFDFGNIEVLGASTPLTKQHYSNGYKGSTYGILCSAKQKSLTMVMPKTRIDNLYLAGESALAPGLLGCYLSSAKIVSYFEELR